MPPPELLLPIALSKKKSNSRSHPRAPDGALGDRAQAVLCSATQEPRTGTTRRVEGGTRDRAAAAYARRASFVMYIIVG